ncbi:MAG: PAS domain-containing protein [Acidobacteria bacterium]|nr:PAS domain-containing protein [Acidobacteriota bacterium]
MIASSDGPVGQTHIVASTRIDPSFLSAYEKYYHSVNVYVQCLKHTAVPEVVAPSQAILPDDELVRTEYYHDYMRPQRIHHSLGILLKDEGMPPMHLGVTRPMGAGAYTGAEIRIAKMVAPHLASAMRLRQHLLRARQRAMTAAHLLDALPCALIQLDARGRVLEMNRSAAEILRANDGLRISGGELSAALVSESAELRRQIAGATRSGDGIAPGGTMRVSRVSARRAYCVTVTPFRQPGAGCPAAVVLVADPESAPELDGAQMCRLFGLTAAEARLCTLLVQGKPLQTVADELGITVSTARTHLKRVLSKTDTRRQSDLIRVLLCSLPVRPVPVISAGGPA